MTEVAFTLVFIGVLGFSIIHNHMKEKVTTYKSERDVFGDALTEIRDGHADPRSLYYLSLMHGPKWPY